MTMVSEISHRDFSKPGHKKSDEEHSDKPNVIIARPIVDEKIGTHRAFRFLMLIYVLLLGLTEVLYIMPILFEHRWDVFGIIFLIGLYFFLGFMHGAIRCILQNSSIKGVFLANKVSADWTYCVICETYRPPRTHHCHVCDTCVLRRDHHCMLLAQCIGRTNWHFFFSGLVFGLLGSSLATWLNLQFVFNNPVFLPPSWTTGFRLLCLISPPGLLWILRQVSLCQSIVFMLTSSTLMIAVMLLVLIVFYLRLIAGNLTLSDRFPGPERRRREAEGFPSSVSEHEVRVLVPGAATPVPDNDDGGGTGNWRGNVSQFLGDNWLKTVFFPFFLSSH